MKKTFSIQHAVLLLAILFTVGCRKEIKQPNEEAIQLNEESTEEAARREGNSDRCRLTSFHYYDGIAGYHQIDHYSYKRGLVNEWAVGYGGVYKMEYNDNGRLKSSRYFNDDVLIYTIHFLYKNNKVFKEIWYNGNTTEVNDIVFYTYNRKYQMTRMESFMGDYYTTNTYTAKGDLASWKFYSGGSPVVSGHYTYYRHYKSPFRLTPGIEYNFPYINSMFGYTERWYSSEKIINYDETGNPSVYYDEDPSQTRWQIGNNNYPGHVDYVDALSGTPLSVGFEFENCGRSNDGGPHKINEMTTNRNTSVSAAKSRSIRGILSGPRDKIKQRVNELKNEMKK